ncbi:MAG: hypothetical protein K2G45_11130 [Lachnospiraceae bacterium]|nr:hypothetical protein [Lachnospiraceae bacterium]
MKGDKLFEVMGDIDEQYIVEARQESHNKKRGQKTIAILVACFGLIVAVLFYIKISGNRLFDTSLTALAEEVGKEEIHMGATMPSIIYVNNQKVIMYDYVGIWVYNYEKEKLAGFCDFRPINMTQIQGYPRVLVEITDDGKYVKFYMSDGSKNYIYDVEKDTCKKVTDYNGYSTYNYELQDITEEYSLSEYSPTYRASDAVNVSYFLDLSNKKDGDAVCYGDIVIIVEKEDGIHKYRPFMSE